MKSVLITGGAGFIGSHLCEKFINEKYKVIVVDNLFRGKRENINHLIEAGLKLHVLDLVDFNNVETISEILDAEKPSLILHYAAINGTQYFYDIPEKVAEVNSIGTYNLLRSIDIVCSKEADYKPCIVFASTSETYGEPVDIPTNEESITYARISEDRDSYSVAKLMSEFYVKLFSKKLNLEYIILRIFNVYGPRMIGTRYGQVIPEFVNRIKSGEYPLSILGDGTNTRSFIYIDDHVELSYLAMTAAKRNEIYNLGNPAEITIMDLAMLVMEKFNLEPRLKYLPPRSGDHMRRVPDISKLLQQVGMYDFTSLHCGLDNLIGSPND